MPLSSITAFFLLLIGFTREQHDAISESKLLHHLVFRSLAILIGCLAFAVAVFAFARGMLDYAIFSAIAFAGVSALVLYLIERNNIMDLLTTGQVSGKTVATRVGVISMMFGAAVALAVFAMKDDIDKRIADKTAQAVKQLQSDPLYAVPMVAAQNAVAQATENTARQSQLQTQLSARDAEYAKAKEAERNECEGNTSPDGVNRIVGCGSRARAHAHANAAASIDAQRVAIQRELNTLQENNSETAAATAQLSTLTDDIKAEAARHNQGAGAKLSALFELFWTDGSVAVILGFYLAVSLMPEILVWTALAKAGIYAPTLKRMHDMETMVNNNRLDVLAEKKRDRYTRGNYSAPLSP